MELLTILKIDEQIYHGKFKSVSLPTMEGQIEILPGHVPIISPLKKGKIKYVTESGEEKEIENEKGFVEINKLEVLIIL